MQSLPNFNGIFYQKKKRKNYPKISAEAQRPPKAKATLRQENKAEDNTLPDFKYSTKLQ